MAQRFVYHFEGNVVFQARNMKEAEKRVTDLKDLGIYIIDEGVHQINAEYVPVGKKKRMDVLGTTIHPTHDEDQYRQFKTRKIRYSLLFQNFLDGKINKETFIQKVQNIDDSLPTRQTERILDEFDFIDMDLMKQKKHRFIYVD